MLSDPNRRKRSGDYNSQMRILVAGVGSTLRRDDAFGVRAAHRLMQLTLPPEVKVIETGTGGIHLVQEMMPGFDALIILDAVDKGREPGTVMVIAPDIEDADAMSPLERFDYLADMHYTKPGKALMLARSLKILPERVLLVGCQPVDAEGLGTALSEPVAAAVEHGVAEVQRIIEELLEEDARRKGPGDD